jgi:uncharacterized membrane protein YoaK (UPF0700 family)
MAYTPPNLFNSFQSGNLSFAYGISLWVFALLTLLIVAAVWLTYLKTTRELTPRWKALLVANRSLILVLILFCLLRPVINTVQVSPQETYLAVLFDDSLSMSIEDVGGESRQSAVAAKFFEDAVIDDLSKQAHPHP